MTEDITSKYDNRMLLRNHIALAVLILVMDQLSKLIILSTIEPYGNLPVTGFFNLVLVYNKGAAFGFLANSSVNINMFFLIANSIILALLAFTLWQLRPGRNQSTTAIWLIIGGALGNMTDRVVHGHVIDFLDFHYAGWHFSAFNVADSAITVGAILIVMELLKIQVLFRSKVFTQDKP